MTVMVVVRQMRAVVAASHTERGCPVVSAWQVKDWADMLEASVQADLAEASATDLEALRMGGLDELDAKLANGRLTVEAYEAEKRALLGINR